MNNEILSTLLPFGLLIIFTIITIIIRKHEKTPNEVLADDRQYMLKPIKYFRDIPFDNLEDAYWAGIHFGLIPNKSTLIGCYLLKWVYEDKVKFIKIVDENGNKKINVDFSKNFKTITRFETKMYGLLRASANRDKILSTDELFRLLKQNNKTIFKLFDELDACAKQSLIDQKLIDYKLDEHNFLTLTYSDEMINKTSRLRGLRNFINDFSNFSDKHIKEIHLWQEYMVYAQLFDIADKIENEFKDLYPDFEKTEDTEIVLNVIKDIFIPSKEE